MNKKFFIFLITACICFSFATYEYSKIPKRSYKNLRVFDLKTGKNHNLEDILGDKLSLIVFHSAHCPFNKVYHEKLDSISQVHVEDSLRVFYVNSNSAENSKKTTDDSVVKFAEAHRGHYILDTYRTIERLFNSTSKQKVKNSTVFLCKQVNNGIKTYYSGPIDDSPQQNEQATPYLEEAILKALEGKISKNEVINTGCRIVNH